MRSLLTLTIGLSLVPLVAIGQEENAANCFALDYDKNAPIAVAKIVGSDAKAHFIKSAADDKSCPAATQTCERKAYLRPGDVVMTGRAFGAFTCVSYVNAKQKETTGWIATSALEPRLPLSAPKMSDWLGKWHSRRDTMQGDIEITRGKRGSLDVRGEATYAVTRDNVRTGDFAIDDLAPNVATHAFVAGGEKPFEKAGEGDCAVRMSRIDQFLLVEDNGYCGGMAVTFTGLYQR